MIKSRMYAQQVKKENTRPQIQTIRGIGVVKLLLEPVQ